MGIPPGLARAWTALAARDPGKPGTAAGAAGIGPLRSCAADQHIDPATHAAGAAGIGPLRSPAPEQHRTVV